MYMCIYIYIYIYKINIVYLVGAKNWVHWSLDLCLRGTPFETEFLSWLFCISAGKCRQSTAAKQITPSLQTHFQFVFFAMTVSVYCTLSLTIYEHIGEGEDLPIMCHEGTDGARWGCVVSATPRPLYPPPQRDPIPVVLVAGWGLKAGLGESGISLPHRGSNAEPRSP